MMNYPPPNQRFEVGTLASFDRKQRSQKTKSRF